ncbi:unnamed protein product [Prunus armeniaca]
MYQPTVVHWLAIKRILRYLNGTLTLGLLYSPSTLHLNADSDADYAGDPDDCGFIGDYCIYFGTNLISWSSKKQRGVSRSSIESEYSHLAYTVATLSWLHALFLDLHLPVPCPNLWCNNISALSLLPLIRCFTLALATLRLIIILFVKRWCTMSCSLLRLLISSLRVYLMLGFLYFGPSCLCTPAPSACGGGTEAKPKTPFQIYHQGHGSYLQETYISSFALYPIIN